MAGIFFTKVLPKLMKPGWSAAGFLSQSKWIFAPIFKWIASTPDVLNIVNLMNIWGLVFIGLGLIVGAFTRTASVAGILLVLLYYFCNPPFAGLYYSIPMEGNYLVINKNLVEVAGLILIAVTYSGRYLGFDRLIHKWISQKKAA